MRRLITWIGGEQDEDDDDEGEDEIAEHEEDEEHEDDEDDGEALASGATARASLRFLTMMESPLRTLSEDSASPASPFTSLGGNPDSNDCHSEASPVFSEIWAWRSASVEEASRDKIKSPDAPLQRRRIAIICQ